MWVAMCIKVVVPQVDLCEMLWPGVLRPGWRPMEQAMSEQGLRSRSARVLELAGRWQMISSLHPVLVEGPLCGEKSW